MVNGMLTGTALLAACCGLAEWLHARRSARLAHLAFGPAARPRAGVGRGAGSPAGRRRCLGWGLLVSCRRSTPPPGTPTRPRRQAAACTTWPSPWTFRRACSLQTAEPQGTQRRAERARDVVAQHLPDRLELRRTRVSILAFYSGAGR